MEVRRARKSVCSTAFILGLFAARAKFPIIYPDLRLDYKVATLRLEQSGNRWNTEHPSIFSSRLSGQASKVATLPQRQRYWVERCFEDGKGQCGMADYQVRLWNAAA